MAAAVTASHSRRRLKEFTGADRRDKGPQLKAQEACRLVWERGIAGRACSRTRPSTSPLRNPAGCARRACAARGRPEPLRIRSRDRRAWDGGTWVPLLAITRPACSGSRALTSKEALRALTRTWPASASKSLLQIVASPSWTAQVAASAHAHPRARTHTHIHTFFPGLHRWRPSGHRRGYLRAAHNGVGVLLESRCQWLARVRVRPVSSKL